MKILVAYESKYGSTREIAERLGGHLEDAGYAVVVARSRNGADPSQYEAVVAGSAAYMGRWMRPASRFVRRNASTLSQRPLWLFSSGPLGNEATGEGAADAQRAAEPKEFAEFAALNPRGTRVFGGALFPSSLGLRDRLIRRSRAGRTMLPAGDFRDWDDIKAWADQIAAELAKLRRDRSA